MESESFLPGIHFWAKTLLSPQVSKCPTEARSGDASLFAPEPSKAGPGRSRQASSPSGMTQVMRVRLLQAFQEDQGQPSEATGPGAMYTGLPVAR